MKKIIALVMAALLVFAFAGCGKKSDTLVMATNAAFPPYEYVDDDGNIVGIDAEIAAAIAEKLGMELEIKDMEFESLLTAVQSGSIDIVLAGMTVTDERKLMVDFSASYATGVQVVIVKEGSDVTMDNLGEKMIGCQRGTTGYIYASDTPENGGYGEGHVIAYDNGITAVQALMNDQIDAVIIDKPVGQAILASLNDPSLVIVDMGLQADWYGIEVNKDNTELLEKINAALAELNAEGFFDQLAVKYFSSSEEAAE